MTTHFHAFKTRFQDQDDVQAPAGAGDDGKVWAWNDATGTFEPVAVVAGSYLPLAGGTLTGTLTMANGIRIETDEVRARDTSGLTLTENAGVVGVFIQDVTGAVAINTTSPGASTALTVDGRIRSRQVGATRYRTDIWTTTANGNLLAYDDTGAAYIPLYIDGLFTVFRTGAAVEAGRFDANGNLIMADAKRIESDEIRARDAGGIFVRDNSGVGGMFVQNGGVVMFNTSTTITGALGPVQVQMNSSLVGTMLLTRDSTTAGNAPTVELLRRRTAFGVLSSGDRLGTIAFSGADSIDAALGASIYAEVDGAPGSNDMPGRIIFATTADGAATATERMRITQAGRVGIGQAAPAALLHVGSTAPTIPAYMGTVQILSIGGGIFMLNNATGDDYAFAVRGRDTVGDKAHFAFAGDNGDRYAVLSGEVSGAGVGHLLFSTAAVANTPAEHMRITSAGRVGIGDTTPDGKLDVAQGSTTAAIPTLMLEQADLSEEFIRFSTTVGAGNPIDTAAYGAYYGKVRVYVEGVGAKWIALWD